MIRYVVRRVLVSIPVFLGILFIPFALARLIPGDPCRAALGERATDRVCDAFIERFGLNKPIPVQFAIYLRDVARGGLGGSLAQGRPGTQILVGRLPVTIELAPPAIPLR